MDYFLARLPLLKKLPEETLEALPRRFLLRKFGRGEPVFSEGDSPGAVFLLKAGLVKAVKYSPRTEPFAMELVVPGGIFGMIAVMDGRPYPVTAVPIRESEAYRIPAAVFDELLRAHPAFAKEVFAEVGRHVRQAQAMRALAKEPVEKRVAYILSLLGDSMGRDLALRREDIAELASCTPETAIRTLAAFRKQGLVAAGWKRVSLLDPAGLKALAGRED